MIKKLTVEQFAKNYDELNTKQEREKYLNENLEIRKYIPYSLKVALVQNIINCSSFDENKNLKLSGTTRYLLYIRTIITQYTNLTENTENSSFLEEYDILASAGLIELIISKIPEREIAEFKFVNDMILNDTITQYTSPQVFISDQLQRFGSLFSKTFEPLVESAAEAVKKYDEKDIEKIIKRISRFIIKKS